MNSLVRRVQNQNDLGKISAVLDTCYQAGQAHEKYDLAQQRDAYVTGRLRDLVQLLGLRFDDKGNIDWHKIFRNIEEDEITTDDLSFDSRSFIDDRA